MDISAQPCEFCGKAVDITDKSNWHKVTGWRKNGGSATVQFQEGPFGHACAGCMQDKKLGIKPEGLF